MAYHPKNTKATPRTYGHTKVTTAVNVATNDTKSGDNIPVVVVASILVDDRVT